MSTTLTAPHNGGSARLLSLASRIAGRAVLVIWSGFWGYFLVADTAGHVIKEQSPIALLYGGGLLLLVLGLGVLGWIRGRIGGAALIAFAIFAFFFFSGAPAMLLMALPPAVAGILLWVADVAGRHAGRMPR